MRSPIAVFVFLLCLAVVSSVEFTTVYEWQELDFAWPTEANRKAALKNGSFIPGKVEPYFLAVHKERLFLSLEGGNSVPVTLASLPTSSASSNAPKLTPFPSWKLHERESCENIGQARGLEVDLDGRLWVVDNGNTHCRAKIWIFNLANNDKVELVHTFPRDVVFRRHLKRRLGDLVLDKTAHDTRAYIADFENAHLIGFSLKRNQSWSVETPAGKAFYSLGLSPKEESRQLYLGRAYSKELYSVPASKLRARKQKVSPKLIGEWTEFPIRMLVDNTDVLYAALFFSSHVASWNTTAPFSEQKIYEVGPLEASTPFTFALDAAGTLWVTQRNETGNKLSHKLLKTVLGTKSYLYGASSR